MSRSRIRQIRAALAVVQESEAIRLHLMVSIHSGSSVHNLIETGLGNYLEATKTTLKVQLVVGYLQMVSGQLSKITLTALRGRWSRITERFKINRLMN